MTSVGFNGVLVTFSDTLTETANRAALAFRKSVHASKIAGLVETTTSLTSTFVIYDPTKVSQSQMRDALSDLLSTEDWASAPALRDRRLWYIPAAFGGDEFGPQLREAAELAGVSPKTAIEELCDARLSVMTLGFAPGQPYLGALPPHWNIPRQTSLTKQTPVGAITVAIRQIVLFSIASPTGWRQVGQCAFRAFRPEADDPFALRPGDEIRFHPVTPDALTALRDNNVDGNGGATCEIAP